MIKLSYAALFELASILFASQCFLWVGVYFVFVRRHLIASYRYYLIFIISLIIYLLGKGAQTFVSREISHDIHFTRHLIFLGLGFPSLLLASLFQSGFYIKKNYQWIIFIIGMIWAGAKCFIMHKNHSDMILPNFIASGLDQISYRIFVARMVYLSDVVIMLSMPILILFFLEWCREKRTTPLTFHCGALIFCISAIIGLALPFTYFLYYFASSVTAILWSFAVFYDIRRMKGTVEVFKEEILKIFENQTNPSTLQLSKLIDNLEINSSGDINHYKLHVREILCMLTDLGIRETGEKQKYLIKNQNSLEVIETLSEPQQLKDILSHEVIDLSNAIIEKANRSKEISDKTYKFLKENFHRDMGVDEIAEEIGISREHLTRQFKKLNDKTVIKALTEIRIEESKVLLKSLSITEASFRVGFNDSGYFSKVFKKETGISPKEYKLNT